MFWIFEDWWFSIFPMKLQEITTSFNLAKTALVFQVHAKTGQNLFKPSPSHVSTCSFLISWNARTTCSIATLCHGLQGFKGWCSFQGGDQSWWSEGLKGISEGWKLRKGRLKSEYLIGNLSFLFGLKDFSAFFFGVVFFLCRQHATCKARRHFWASIHDYVANLIRRWIYGPPFSPLESHMLESHPSMDSTLHEVEVFLWNFNFP